MSLDVVATLTCTSCAAWCPDLKHGKGQLTQFDSCTAMKRPEGDRYAVKTLRNFCRQLVWERAFLQADPEHAAMDIVNAACEKLTNLVPKESPTNQKDSQEELERHHKWLERDARSLRTYVRETCDIEVPTDHPIFVWAIRRGNVLGEAFTKESGWENGILQVSTA